MNPRTRRQRKHRRKVRRDHERWEREGFRYEAPETFPYFDEDFDNANALLWVIALDGTPSKW